MTDLDANELVNDWIARRYREDGDNPHLRECPDLAASDIDGRNGSYGCDTGCEYARLEAEMTCPHDEHDEFEYGTFGDLAGIIADIEAGATA